MPDAAHEHPAGDDLVMRTAEVLAAADPPVALCGPSIDPALRQLEAILPVGVRVAILRARAGDWEIRPFDPKRPRNYGPKTVGRGATLGGAIRELCAKLGDPVARVAHGLAA